MNCQHKYALKQAGAYVFGWLVVFAVFGVLGLLSWWLGPEWVFGGVGVTILLCLFVALYVEWYDEAPCSGVCDHD